MESSKFPPEGSLVLHRDLFQDPVAPLVKVKRKEEGSRKLNSNGSCAMQGSEGRWKTMTALDQLISNSQARAPN